MCRISALTGAHQFEHVMSLLLAINTENY